MRFHFYKGITPEDKGRILITTDKGRPDPHKWKLRKIGIFETGGVNDYIIDPEHFTNWFNVHIIKRLKEDPKD